MSRDKPAFGQITYILCTRVEQFKYLGSIVTIILPVVFYGCDSLGAIWGMGMLSSCICSTLMSVCAMKDIPIGPLAQ